MKGLSLFDKEFSLLLIGLLLLLLNKELVLFTTGVVVKGLFVVNEGFSLLLKGLLLLNKGLVLFTKGVEVKGLFVVNEGYSLLSLPKKALLLFNDPNGEAVLSLPEGFSSLFPNNPPLLFVLLNEAKGDAIP